MTFVWFALTAKPINNTHRAEPPPFLSSTSRPSRASYNIRHRARTAYSSGLLLLLFFLLVPIDILIRIKRYSSSRLFHGKNHYLNFVQSAFLAQAECVCACAILSSHPRSCYNFLG